MKFKLLIYLLCLGQVLFGQSDRHIRIAGTKCSLIPPDNYVIASDFYGFQNTNTGISIKIDEQAFSYQDAIAVFDTDIFNTRRMSLLDKQEIDFNNSKAILVKIRHTFFDSTYLTLTLIFGNEEETVNVRANYPDPGSDIENEINEALLSTVYNANQNDNPLEAATFTVDITGTEFKFIKFRSGNLHFSTDGKIPTKGPTLEVERLFRKISPEDQKEYAEDRLKNFRYGGDYIIKEIKDITIDNLKGYEIIAEEKSNDEENELVYQVILYNDTGGYYLIVGHTKEEFQQYIMTFRKITMTFKRK